VNAAYAAVYGFNGGDEINVKDVTALFRHVCSF
jgi:hypothetical protein